METTLQVMLRILLAELFAQTDLLRIVATLTGSGNFLLQQDSCEIFVGGREMSKRAAAFLGINGGGSELQLIGTLFRFFGKRNDDLSE